MVWHLVAPATEQRFGPGPDHVVAERLDEVVIGACVAARLDVCGGRPSGHDEDRGCGRGRVGTQRPAHVQAVHARHGNVEHDQGVLNFVIDDEAQAIVNRLLDAVPPGSYLAIAHASNEVNPAEAGGGTAVLE